MRRKNVISRFATLALATLACLLLAVLAPVLLVQRTADEPFSGYSVMASPRDMHVITPVGQTYAGFDAYRSLAWVIPLLWLVLPLLYLPPVKWLGSKIYRRVADNRCTTACRLPQGEQSM